MLMIRKLPGNRKGLAIAAAAAAAAIVLIFAASLLLRVDAGRAREIALSAVGGGTVIAQEIDREGLWNEYSYHIQNGDARHEVEVDAFGTVTSLESVPLHSGRWD